MRLKAECDLEFDDILPCSYISYIGGSADAVIMGGGPAGIAAAVSLLQIRPHYELWNEIDADSENDPLDAPRTADLGNIVVAGASAGPDILGSVAFGRRAADLRGRSENGHRRGGPWFHRAESLSRARPDRCRVTDMKYISVERNGDELWFALGSGTIDIHEVSSAVLAGTIGGDVWLLHLHGYLGYGSPMQARFQG